MVNARRAARPVAIGPTSHLSSARARRPQPPVEAVESVHILGRGAVKCICGHSLRKGQVWPPELAALHQPLL